MSEIINTGRPEDCEPSYAEVALEKGLNLEQLSRTIRDTTFHTPVINWSAELKKKQPKWEDLSIAAGNWVSCACGNTCAIITRDNDGAPKDEELRHLGMRFYEAIVREDRLKSKKILKDIEKRSTYLIQQIYAQQAGASPQ